MLSEHGAPFLLRLWQEPSDDACGSGLSFCVLSFGNCSKRGRELAEAESMGIAGQERTSTYHAFDRGPALTRAGGTESF